MNYIITIDDVRERISCEYQHLVTDQQIAYSIYCVEDSVRMMNEEEEDVMTWDMSIGLWINKNSKASLIRCIVHGLDEIVNGPDVSE